jgi:predicted RNA-binding Zn-ribbon protein involved in translation (DUF1610 family)
MEPLTSGTYIGGGSFRCASCDYALTLDGPDVLGDCPSCGGMEFVRASLFNTKHSARAGETQIHRGDGLVLALASTADEEARLETALERIDQPGEYLCYEESGELRTVALTREWTRIGRSLAADVRFDDPTVSRRHALIVRHPDGVRLLDDRSLNGVFVNGARVDGKALKDGDEIVVGRYRLRFVSVSADQLALGASSAQGSLHPIG